MPLTTQNLSSTGINGSHTVYSNYFADNHIIQQTCVVAPKFLLIDILRSEFSKDNLFTYRQDEFGFPLVKDLTGTLPQTEESTNIVISDTFRMEAVFFPSIVVKHSSSSYAPISFNQEGTYKYRKDYTTTAWGKRVEITTPTHKVYAGAWDGNFDIEIRTKSQKECQMLSDMISMMFVYSSRNQLAENGLFINTINISGENSEPYSNGFIYNQTISINTRSEWRVEIPMDNLIEKIIFYFDSVKTPNGIQADKTDLMALQFTDTVENARIEI